MPLLRRILTVIGVVVVVGVVASGAYFMLRDRLSLPGASSASQTEAERAAVIGRGDLRETVSVTAPLEARQRSDLTFLLSGKVAIVNVTTGQRVQAGDLLMQLDTSAYELNIADAALAVELQQVALEQLQAGPSQFDVAAASAAVQQAQAQLDRLSQPVSDEAIRIAQANLQIAESQRLIAYQNWTNQEDLYPNGGYAVDLARKQAEASEMAVQIAVLELANAQEGASSSQVASARAAVRQAQAALSRLLEGPSDIDIQLAQLQIEQAELALENARASLNDAQIIAPYDGVVVAVHYRPGESATAGLPAVTLIDDSQFYIDVLVDEIDIARVAPGQLAFIGLDAYPEAHVSGHVLRISPVAISIAGVNSFEVRIGLDAADVPLRDGMTATVDIVVSELTDVLLVPNWAIRFDQATGTAFVNVQRPDGSVEEVPIDIGKRGATMSEVRSGLQEGDIVVVSLGREELDLFGGGE